MIPKGEWINSRGYKEIRVQIDYNRMTVQNKSHKFTTVNCINWKKGMIQSSCSATWAMTAQGSIISSSKILLKNSASK